MEEAHAYWDLVERTGRCYVAQVQHYQLGAAKRLIGHYRVALGLPGWVDLCAVMLCAAVAACPQEMRDAKGAVDAEQLTRDLMASSERWRLARRVNRRARRRPRRSTAHPDTAAAATVARFDQGRQIVRAAIDAGGGLAGIHATLSPRVTRELAGPVMMYVTMACTNSGVDPETIAGLVGRQAGTRPVTP